MQGNIILKQMIDEEVMVDMKEESNSQIIFQYSEETDQGTKEEYFVIRIMVTNDMKAKMQQIIDLKNEKLTKLEAKEKLPEFVKLKQKYEIYKKMDERVRQQQKKRNLYPQNLKPIAQYQSFLLLKEKYSFNLFQTIDNRGKYNFIKYSYNSTKQNMIIRINKRYFLNEINLSRKDLFNIGLSFTRTWQHDYHRFIMILWKCYVQSQKNIHYTVTITKIDMISASFDIIYLDKKIYRFRYSPFQFRNHILFRTDHHFTGYYQSISCIHDLYNTKSITADNQYYHYQRLFIFDDLTDRQIFVKIFSRSHIFFQMYSISKGIIYNTQNLPTIEMDDYFKKCLGQFYFTSIRLKKFMFTWSFKIYKRLRTKYETDKEVILNVPFYFQQIKEAPNSEPIYRLRMQLLQKLDRNSPTYISIPVYFKEELVMKIREWYFFVKEVMLFTNKQKFYLDNQKVNFGSKKSTDYDDYQMNIQFFSKDKIDKFFIGLLLVISTAIDRYYFHQRKNLKDNKQSVFKQNDDRQRKMQDRRQLRKDERYSFIESPETQYIISKKEYIYYYHSIKIIAKHRYLPNMFYFNKDDERQKTSLNNFFNTNKHSDYKIKCGEWRIQEIVKVKKKEIKKDNNSKEVLIDKEPDAETSLISISPPIRAYFATLLKHIPLRTIYKDIIYFLDRFTKTCFSMPHKESSLLHLTEYEHTMNLITRSILKEYYYCQFREKDPKIQKESVHAYIEYCENKAKVSQDYELKSIQPDKMKAFERIQDLFSKLVVIKIITRQDIGFKSEKNLLFEVTFKILQFKNNWITRLKEGYIIVRVFEHKIQFQKEFNLVEKIQGELKGKKISEQQIRKGLKKCQIDVKSSLAF